MSSKIFQITSNGQQVQRGDFNSLGEIAGLAEDHVFAELLRMTPYDGSTVSRGVLPPTTGPLVASNGATGRVVINPFRAFIGSRTAEASEALDNRQDIRSVVSIAEGATNDVRTVLLAANASGNSRWDLVYAAVTVDANSASVTRKIKDTTTAVVTATSVVITKVQTMTVGAITGTPGASPAFPSITADGGGVYYIPLAYVRVPDGFGGSSTVANKNINIAATCLAISSPGLGTGTTRPATSISKVGGAGLAGSGTSAYNGVNTWTGTNATRPGAYMSPTMVGTENLLIAVDLTHATSTNWSHQTGDVIDNSRDWRGRMFRWVACVASGSSTNAAKFPWNTTSTAAVISGGSKFQYSANVESPALTMGVGSSFASSVPTVAVLIATGASSAATPEAGSNVPTNAMDSSTAVVLYVDDVTGELKIDIDGVPKCSVFFWIEATSQFPNI